MLHCKAGLMRPTSNELKYQESWFKIYIWNSTRYNINCQMVKKTDGNAYYLSPGKYKDSVITFRKLRSYIWIFENIWKPTLSLLTFNNEVLSFQKLMSHTSTKNELIPMMFTLFVINTSLQILLKNKGQSSFTYTKFHNNL